MKNLLLMAGFVTLLHITTRFVPGAIAWDFYSFAKQAETSILVMYALSLISYKKLAIKSILAAWLVTELVSCGNLAFWIVFQKNFIYPLLIKSGLSLAWVLYIWFRNYDRANDCLDNDHFFMVGIRPSSPQDFILSLIKEPHGGVGIYFHGKFYHYRKGVLQTHDRKFLERAGSKYRILKIRKVDQARRSVLRSLLNQEKYRKWSWKYNCKTVLEPILGSRGKPLV